MIPEMNTAPVSTRTVIALFGRRNAGKSSLINALTGQQTALASPVPGTTTDPVYKAMELLPIGPVVFVDTAGLDDEGELGELRVGKTREVLEQCHLALLVTDAAAGITPDEEAFLRELRAKELPTVLVLNKCDEHPVAEAEIAALGKRLGVAAVKASAASGEGIPDVKRLLVEAAEQQAQDAPLLSDIVAPGELVVLVTPIDSGAPKGRMILPQQQVLRALLDVGAMALFTRETELASTLEKLSEPPALVITDSQAFAQVAPLVPAEVILTSFSILFARQKGDLAAMARGARAVDQLRAGDRVLISEGCTHHRQRDDIGTVKLPRLIRSRVGEGVEFDWSAGNTFPRALSDYALIAHCGACMLNAKEMSRRLHYAEDKGVPVTNYGVLIAHLLGILDRALQPFPEAAFAYRLAE